mmetsp:Transcript_4028/g.6188  ORF Transcript_4028/g.6188 Transcript_4028/m.6188 type:complete len:243 (+) Transcript_4028:34-762(+)
MNSKAIRTLVLAAFVTAANGKCSICGEGKEVGNLDGVFEFPDQPQVPCDLLQEAGIQGAIPEAQCDFLPPLLSVCECQPIDQSIDQSSQEAESSMAPVVDPTEAPVVDPTEAPIVDPTEAPVGSTEDPVADPTEAPVDPTEAPVDPTPVPVVVRPATVSPVIPITREPTFVPVVVPDIPDILGDDDDDDDDMGKGAKKGYSYDDDDDDDSMGKGGKKGYSDYSDDDDDDSGKGGKGKKTRCS